MTNILKVCIKSPRKSYKQRVKGTLIHISKSTDIFFFVLK